jgi:hypothetical protein
MTDHYHIDSGTGADMYTAGTSRGVGGDGLWDDGRLWVSKNQVHSHVFTNGPIRVMFRLKYNAFDVNGNSVKETKRVTLDAGQNLSHYDITYHPEKSKKLIAGIGIEKTDKTKQEVRKGIDPNNKNANLERPPGAFKHKDVNEEHGWIATQQPLSKGKLYAAIIVNPKHFVKATTDKKNQLVLAKAPGNHISYWAGFAWSKSGQFKDYHAWKTYVDHFAQKLQSPIQVTVSNQ